MKPYKKVREIIDNTETEAITESLTSFQANSFGSYSKHYVKELEKELLKLTKENIYLKSDEYQNKILPQDYIQKLEDKINEFINENNNLINENLYLKSYEYQKKILTSFFKEKELMTKKIYLLSLLIRRFSCELIDREDILATLKEILEMEE